ncbi:MAG: site-specific integrase [Acidobacteriota bacterium]|nr:site-specific integrase [Acidobacteriota bacterium]
MTEKEKKRRARGQVIPLGSQPGYKPNRQDFGIRVPLKERGSNGRSRTHYETIHNVTESQAEGHRSHLLFLIDRGEFFVARKITVEDFSKEWLKQKERDGLKRQTLYNYGDQIKFYVNPYIGRLMLGDVKGSTVRDLYNALQDRGLAHKTILLVAHLVRYIFKDAKTLGYIKENPAEGIKAPAGAGGREQHVFTPEQALKFIEVCTRELRDLIFVLYLTTGLRPKELTGLTWPHLKLVRQAVEVDGLPETIERGLVEVRQIAFKERGRQGQWIFTKPKTKKSVRDVPFPAALYHSLVAYREEVKRQKALMGSSWTEFNLVFPSPKGTPIDFHYLRDGRFRALLKRAELPTHFTLYSLRYSFATLQLLAGERDKVIAELMGHARVSFNQEVYQKVLPVMRERASDRLEKLLFDDSCTILAQPVSEQEM